MKDELSFYACDTKILEEKIMTRDMVEGTEIAGHLERLGQHLGTIYFNKVSIGEIFKQCEALTGAPFKFLMGMGARRLEPCGPVTYCGRQIPSELGEFSFQIDRIQKLIKKDPDTLDDASRKIRDAWLAFIEKSGLNNEDPGCMDALRKFLDKYKTRTPELISVYTRW